MKRLSIENYEVKKNQKTLVKVENFEITSGQKVLILGSNGSGKSSLLFGLMSYPDYMYSGSVLFEDTDITSKTTEEKGKLGIFFSPQDIPSIEGLTLLQLLYGIYKKNTDNKQSIIEYKKEIENIISEFELSSELLLKYIGHGVSGGEKKQMELIALLILKPKLALLDEIDSGVDFETVQKIYAVIDSLANSGTSFILVSHNLTEIKKINPDVCYICKDGVLSLLGGIDSIDTIIKKGY